MKKTRVTYAKTASSTTNSTTSTNAQPKNEATKQNFANLLQQEVTLEQSPKLPQSTTPALPAVHGVVLGNLIAKLGNGRYEISLRNLGIAHTAASAACQPELLDVGAEIAVMFLQGDTNNPLIIGPLYLPNDHLLETKLALEGNAQELLVDKQVVQIQAQQELELRCGEAAIVLTSDGRILLRGSYISSHATATQRLLGGSIQIN